MSDEDLTVETAGAGASDTFPLEAGQLKKGDHVCLKGRPCKIAEITTSKTGKHGHAKAHIIAIDIFTQKKLEENCPTTHNMECPRVKRMDYQVADVLDGHVSCLDETGAEVAFPIPATEIGPQLEKKFADGADLMVTVVEAMGEQHIMTFKEDTKA